MKINKQSEQYKKWLAAYEQMKAEHRETIVEIKRLYKGKRFELKEQLDFENKNYIDKFYSTRKQILGY